MRHRWYFGLKRFVPAGSLIVKGVSQPLQPKITDNVPQEIKYGFAIAIGVIKC
jgi:hypothetical protein